MINRPIIVESTAVSVIMILVFIIIMSEPTRSVIAETRVLILILNDCVIVSTSFVTRERISPVVVLL